MKKLGKYLTIAAAFVVALGVMIAVFFVIIVKFGGGVTP